MRMLVFPCTSYNPSVYLAMHCVGNKQDIAISQATKPPKFCLWELATFRIVATAQLRLRAFLKPSSGDVCVPFIFNVVKAFRVQRRLRATQRQNEAIQPIDGRQCRGYNCGLWGGDTYSERCSICRIDCACSCVIRPATIYVGTPVVHQLSRQMQSFSCRLYAPQFSRLAG